MTSSEKRQAVVASYLTRKGCNAYTQGAKRDYFYGYPADGRPGYSDCSSSWREAYRRVLGIDIGGNTAAQIVNRNLIEVCLQTRGQPDQDKLLPGDLLFFKGSDPSRPYGVGHVEGFVGNGQIAGHGSGTGPRVTGMKSYCADRYAKGRGLIKVLRAIPDDGAEPPAKAPLGVLGFGARMLRFGCAGADVANLQRALIGLGYSCGKWGADGDFGAATKNAVRAYQKAKKIEVDGIVGPNTVAALEADLRVAGDSDEAAEDTRRRVVIRGGDAFVRVRPDTSGRILGVAWENESYPWRGETSKDGWQAVDLDGEDGWVSGKYAKL